MRLLHEGNVARFRGHDPRRALELYAGAERAGQPFAIFLQGDTWQFDLRDKSRAVAEYRRNLDKLAAVADTQRGGGDERAFVEWAKRWLRHQIAFLESGRTFSGTIGREDIAGVGLLIYLGSGDVFDDGIPRIEPPDVARELAALPSSGWVLMRTSGLLGQVPDARSVLEYLARNDPAGYASACFFGLVDLAARESARPGASRGDRLGFADSTALLQARDRFLRERRVTLGP